MLANGIGARQLAMRSALYSVANDAMSAELVPGTPLASDAPGAPAVEPPIAAGQVGVGGGVVVAVGAVNVAGALVNVCVLPLASVLAAAKLEPELLPPPELDGAEVAVAEVLELVAESFAAESAAVSDLGLRRPVDAALPELAVAELAIVTLLARDSSGVTDDPAPWTMITAATIAVAINTAFFNVCTPIQRLHCPPNETSAYLKPRLAGSRAQPTGGTKTIILPSNWGRVFAPVSTNWGTQFGRSHPRVYPIAS
jgi:hypothetical protein